MIRGRIALAGAGEGGIALVIVLWLIVLMSVIASGHSRNVRLETQLASRHVDAASVRHIAEAAVELTVLQLLTAGRARQGIPTGDWQSLSVFDHETSVSVRHVDGLVDLNAAGDRLLATLFASAGADAQDARRLAAAVQDWRDADSIARAGGAETDDYRGLGLPWGVSNGRFRRIDELRYVLGMTNDLFSKVAPLITVHSGRAGVDISEAPEALVAALAESGLPTDSRSTASAIGSGPYQIIASVKGDGETRVSIEAVVLLGGENDEAFTILEWRESSRWPADGDEGLAI